MSREAQIAASGGSIHEHRKSTRKMRWWYESLADYMVANPRATQNDAAAHFGRSVSAISTIVNTDAFKAYFRQRRAAHVEVLDASVRDKLLKVTDLSLDIMLDKLDKKRDTIPLELLQRTTESTLKSLGYGVTPQGPAVNVNVHNNPQTVNVGVTVDELNSAREALRRHQQNITPTIEHEPALGPGRADEAPLGAQRASGGDE